MVHLFPIAVWRGTMKVSGTNGENRPFYCWAKRDHPFAAAIMAQEIYESRYQTLGIMAVSVVITTIGSAIGMLGFDRTPNLIDLGVLAMGGLVVGALLMGLFPRWLRHAEVGGQTVTALVRQQWYGTPEADTIARGVRVMGINYEQFKGSTPDQIEAQMLRRIPSAQRWIKRNRGTIQRAFDQAKPN